MNEYWDILGIEPTDDLKIVKSAYAKLIKLFRPEQDPERFKNIREAYESIVDFINSGIDNTEIDTTVKRQPNEVHLALDDLMNLYSDTENRNNIELWKQKLNAYNLILSSDNNNGYSLFSEIIKFEHLYKNNLKLHTDIYILLIDFFDLQATDFILETYNTNIAKTLIDEIQQRRRNLRIFDIPRCKFNNNSNYRQAQAEFFLEDEVLPYYGSKIFSREQNLVAAIKDADELYHTEVYRRVIFKYILDLSLQPGANIDPYMAGVMYKLFNFNQHKRGFIKVFSQLQYHRQDVINCLELCRQAYIDKVRGPLWAHIPGAAIVFFSYIKLKQLFNRIASLTKKLQS